MTEQTDGTVERALDDLCRLDDEFGLTPEDVRWVRERAQTIRAALAAAGAGAAEVDLADVLRAHAYARRSGFCYDSREGKNGARCDWTPAPEYDPETDRVYGERDQHADHVADEYVAALLAAQGGAAPTVTAEQVARAETVVYEWLNRRAADSTGADETTTVQALMRDVRAAHGIEVTP